MNDSGHTNSKVHYLHLIAELAVDFVVMYLVMYAMIASVDHLYLNINTTYMTLMMLAPMAAIMVIAMRSMFPSVWLNRLLLVVAAVVFVGSFAAIRFQVGVDDRSFLRSMIPHHSGAILMCGQAKLKLPETQALCRTIIESQQREIEQMQTLLGRT